MARPTKVRPHLGTFEESKRRKGKAADKRSTNRNIGLKARAFEFNAPLLSHAPFNTSRYGGPRFFSCSHALSHGILKARSPSWPLLACLSAARESSPPSSSAGDPLVHNSRELELNETGCAFRCLISFNFFFDLLFLSPAWITSYNTGSIENGRFGQRCINRRSPPSYAAEYTRVPVTSRRPSSTRSQVTSFQ